MNPATANPMPRHPGENLRRLRAAALGVALAVSVSATGQSRVGPSPLGNTAAPLPAEVQEVEKKGVEQKLGNNLPLDAKFVDQAGRPVTLGDYFRGDKPVVIEFAYYDCPLLCPMVMSGISDAAEAVGDDWVPGQQYEIVTISINPDDTPVGALEQQKKAAESLGGAEAPLGASVADGWHFLTGRDLDIRRVAEAAGFNYAKVERTNDYAHAAVLVFASPDGVITRYLPGHVYPQRDFRIALGEAAEGKQGSFFDMVLQLCYHFDATLGAYTADALMLMKLAGAVTLAALIAVIGGMFYFERRRRTRLAPGNDNSGNGGSDNSNPPPQKKPALV